MIKVDTSQFSEFCKETLGHIKLGEIQQSTVLSLLTMSYFLGAWDFYSNLNGENGTTNRESFEISLGKILGLSKHNTAGFVDTTQRLINKYKLLQNANAKGHTAALAYLGSQNSDRSLNQLLQVNKMLSMNELGVEGLQDDKVLKSLINKSQQPASNTSSSISRHNKSLTWLKIYLIIGTISVLIALLWVYYIQ